MCYFTRKLELVSNILRMIVRHNLTATCLCCWSTGLTNSELSLHYNASAEMHTSRVQRLHLLKVCTCMLHSNSAKFLSLDQDMRNIKVSTFFKICHFQGLIYWSYEMNTIKNINNAFCEMKYKRILQMSLR